MTEPLSPSPIITEQSAVPNPEELGISRPDLWHSMGVEFATMFASDQDFSFVSESSYWYMLFRGPQGEMRAMASVVTPRYSPDTLAQLSHHFSARLGIQSAGYFLRETVINAMQTRKSAENLPKLFEDERVLRVHMMQTKDLLLFPRPVTEEGLTIERVQDREKLVEAISLTEEGQNEQSIFRRVRPDFAQVETIGIYLLRDSEGHALSTVTLVRNQGIVGVWNMATHPDKRKKGYGGIVLCAAISESDFRNAKYVHLLSMPGAVNFYREHGFIPTERAIYSG